MISILSTLCKWLPKWKAIKGQDIIEIAFKEAAVREQVHACIIFNLCHFFFIIKFDYAFLNLFCLILNRLEQINIATKGHLGWKLAMSFSELAWIWKRGFRRFVSSHICITCIPCVFYITIKLSWFFRSITLQVSLPFLVLHGEEDKVTDQSASKELFEVASSKDKDLKLYPGMWHGLLYGEPLENINIVFRDIINWLDKRVSSGNSEM